MRDAVANVPLAERINFDFYDASRIAHWVNCFPGVAIEARNEIGRPLTGWRPFENWSTPQISTLQKYLIEDEPKATFGVGACPRRGPVTAARRPIRAGAGSI